MERRRRKAILKDIKKAKRYYTTGEENFMCMCFFRADRHKYIHYEEIHKLIPEFNRETMGAKTPPRCSAWWGPCDRESRIKAFDKLIEIYSK